MDGVLIRGEERSSIQTSGPTVEEITNAYRQAAAAPVLSSAGSWVGPRPRISRSTGLGVGAYQARCAWIWRWNASVPAARRERLAEFLESNVGLQLAYQSPDWTTSRETYAPALHGTEDWWISGRAAVTNSAVEYPTGISRVVDPIENPTGPTVPGVTTPTTPGAAAKQALDALGTTAAWLLVPVILGLGLVYFGPAAGATASALAPKREAHANPRRRRR